MCRAGGRRCEKKWDDSHKERYNARRRVVRNTEKAEAAAAAGDTPGAVEYAHLAADAAAVADRLDHEIDQHEFASARDPRLPDSTRSVGCGDHAVDDVPLERAGDRKRVVNTAADHGVDPEGAEHFAENLDRWAGRLQHPRVAMVRDRDGTTLGTLVYEDDRAQFSPEVVIKDMRATSKERQGKGAGSTLIEHMRNTARTGLQRPSGKTVPRRLTVTNVIGSAQGFYEKTGAAFTPGLSVGEFDLDPTSGRCPDCGQWANASHQCEVGQGDGANPTPSRNTSTTTSGPDEGTVRCQDCGQIGQQPGHAGCQGEATAIPETRTMTGAHGDEVTVTPGVLDENADEAFMRGQCVALATAIAEDRGWGVAVHWYDYGKGVKHAYAVDENGDYWDVRGNNDPEAVREAVREPHASDEMVQEYPPGSVQRVLEHTQGAGKIRYQDRSVAASFVAPLMEAHSAQEMAPGDVADEAQSRCPRCGRYTAAAHDCPAPSEEALTSWRGSLTADEQEARSDYGSILAVDLNEKLRDHNGSLDSLTPDEKTIVAGMDSAIGKAPQAEAPYTVHRGISTRHAGKGLPGPEWVAVNAQPGQTLTFHGYTSTSLDPEQAEYFAGVNQEYTESGVIFEIETSQAANWGSEGPEAEVTLARGSGFEVVSVDDTHEVNGKAYPKVSLREVSRCPDCGQFAGSNHDCPTTAETGEDRDYRMGHRAPWNDSETEDPYYNHVANLTQSFPEDVYEHPDWYGTVDEETLTQLRAAREDPDAPLTIYRAVPEGVDEINRGDWITLSHAYAEQHSYGLESGNRDGVVISREVPASQVWTDGNDLGEYGYDGPADLVSPAAPSVQPEAAPRHPLMVSDPEPVDFAYIRRTGSSYENVSDPTAFGRDVEPAGRYLSANEGFVPDGAESGTVRFEQPLHLSVGDDSYASPENWKRQLSAHYDGKTGKALSQAIRDDGYDAITTRDKYGMGEVVDLTGFTPTTGGDTKPGKSPAKTKWDRRRKYTPKDASGYGEHLREKHGVEVRLSGGPDSDSYVSMGAIIVPDEKRGTGLGKKVMGELVKEADRNGWNLSLTPDGEWGSSVPRLKKFYKEFGFRENRGRHKDYRASDTMIRQPGK